MKQIISYTIGDNLYLNITDRCTLECQFCPKINGSWQVHDYNLQLQHRPEVAEIESAIGNPQDYKEIVFCGYGEPTLRLKPLLEIAGYIKQHGGKVRINSDGLANLVHKRNVIPEMVGLVDSISISLNAQNEELYNRHCHPSLPNSFDAVLEFIELAAKELPKVVVTALDGLEGVDIAACKKLAEERGAEFRARKLGLVG